MSVLNKADIINYLNEKFGFNKKESKLLIDSFFEQIRFSLENNEPVKLSGFGSFELRDKSARPGRNPKTGEAAEISPRRVVTFKASKILKSKVESHAENSNVRSKDRK